MEAKMSHFTTLKLSIKDQNILVKTLQEMNFETKTEKENIVVRFNSKKHSKNAFYFVKSDSDCYQIKYDLWSINTYGQSEYWTDLTEQKLESLLQDFLYNYTKNLVKEEAKKLIPEYGEFVLEEKNGNFKLTFPQMQQQATTV